MLYAYNGYTGALGAEITDFAAGPGGDIIRLSEMLATGWLSGYPAGSNPFSNGYAQIVDDGLGNTLLQFDYNGPTGGANFVTVLKLDGVAAGTLTTDNFNPELLAERQYRHPHHRHRRRPYAARYREQRHDHRQRRQRHDLCRSRRRQRHRR